MALRDAQILKALLADDRLNEVERKAFADMFERIDIGVRSGLTKPQREWADRRYKELELEDEAGSVNLHSSGIVPQGIADPSKRHYEKLALPLAPPHILARNPELADKRALEAKRAK